MNWKTKQIYNRMFTEQKGCCAICGKHQSEFNRALGLDHCHKTEIMRGLLCTKCNLGIGYFDDNVERLLKAAIYLRRNYGFRTDDIEALLGEG